MDLTEAEQVIWRGRFRAYTNEALVEWAEQNDGGLGTTALAKDEILRRVEAGTFKAAEPKTVAIPFFDLRQAGAWEALARSCEEKT